MHHQHQRRCQNLLLVFCQVQGLLKAQAFASSTRNSKPRYQVWYQDIRKSRWFLHLNFQFQKTLVTRLISLASLTWDQVLRWENFASQQIISMTSCFISLWKRARIMSVLTDKNMVMSVLLIDMNSEFRTLNKSFSNSLLLRCYG